MLEVGEEDCGQDFSRKEVTIERSSLMVVFGGFIWSLLLLLIFIYYFFSFIFNHFLTRKKNIK